MRLHKYGLGMVIVAVTAMSAACSSGGGTGANPDLANAAQQTAKSTVTALPTAATLPPEFQPGSTITIAVSANFPPFAFTDTSGKDVGFFYDMDEALAKKLGVTFKYEKSAASATIPGIKAHRFALATTGFSDNPVRRQETNFVDYMNNGIAILFDKDASWTPTSPDDLCGHSVSVITGTTQAAWLDQSSKKCESAGKAKITISVFDNTGAVDLAFQSKRVEAAVTTMSDAAYKVKTSGKNWGLLHVPGQDTVMAIMFAKDNVPLMNAVYQAMKSLFADGTMKTLADKWGLADTLRPDATINQG